MDITMNLKVFCLLTTKRKTTVKKKKTQEMM